MYENKIRIFLGIGLIPICEGEEAPMVPCIIKLRRELEAELGITIPAVRIQDDINYKELSVSIYIDGERAGQKTYESFHAQEIADDISALLESCIRNNLASFV